MDGPEADEASTPPQSDAVHEAEARRDRATNEAPPPLLRLVSSLSHVTRDVSGTASLQSPESSRTCLADRWLNHACLLRPSGGALLPAPPLILAARLLPPPPPRRSAPVRPPPRLPPPRLDAPPSAARQRAPVRRRTVRLYGQRSLTDSLCAP